MIYIRDQQKEVYFLNMYLKNILTSLLESDLSICQKIFEIHANIYFRVVSNNKILYLVQLKHQQ